MFRASWGQSRTIVFGTLLGGVVFACGAVALYEAYVPGRVSEVEGSVVMQVKGGKEVTLTPGQTFYESPNDIHIVDRNASKTQPAKFLVFLIKDKGAPALVPVK